MLLVKPQGGNKQASKRGEVKDPLVCTDTCPDLVDDADARAERDGGGGQQQQRAHFALALDAEENDAIERGGRRPGERGKRRGAICRHYTRSLDFSAIRPVGHQVMMAMMTASANTSL